jgi:hypothetical protein
VRHPIDVFNRRDVDASWRSPPNFEYDWRRSMSPNSGLYRGPEGFMEFVNEHGSVFE